MGDIFFVENNDIGFTVKLPVNLFIVLRISGEGAATLIRSVKSFQFGERRCYGAQ